MMGAGKSEVGRRVARRLGLTCVDTDSEVVVAAGRSVAELWSERGERTFRDREEEAVARLAAGSGRVVATGGGVVLREDDVARMRRSGVVVWLEATAELLAARAPADGTRPLLVAAGEETTADRLVVILAAPRPAYRRAAHHVVAPAGRDAGEVGEEVAGLWTGS